MTQKPIVKRLTANNMEAPVLPLPPIRCLSKEEAAAYLGIGLTLMNELQVPCIKFGRRTVYDKVDLDAWLEEYKLSERGRVGKESVWTNKPQKESTVDLIHATGGLMQRSQTANEYAKALGLKTDRKQKHF